MTPADQSQALRDTIERRCLSAMFKDSAHVLSAVTAGLKADHFGDEKHRLCFLALIAAANAREPVPFEALYIAALAAKPGDGMTAADLVAIDALEPTSMNLIKLIEGVISISKHTSLVAQLKAATLKAMQAPALEWSETWATVAPELAGVRDLGTNHTTLSFAQQCDAYIEAQRHPERVKLVALGMPSWDREATPVKSHELVTLAGRPGTGKTTLSLQMADHVATRAKDVVAYFSLEMTAGELIGRLAVHRVGVDAVGDHPRSVERRIAEAEKLRALKTLRVFDDPKVTVDEIEARCRLLAAEPGGLGLVVIDYLQLITPPAETRREGRERQVAEMSRRLKLMPKAIGAPVLLLAQLNRDSETENRAPRKSDLRESGAIEQDSDRIWLLYPPLPDKKGDMVDPAHVVLLQDKCRGGPPHVATLLYLDGPCYKFTPVFGRGV